jgi:hypothetical protein
MPFKDCSFVKAGPNETTRFIYVSGLGDAFGTDPEIIRTLFSTWGELDYSSAIDPVYFVEGRRYCFVIYRQVKSAEAATKALGESKELPEEVLKNLPEGTSRFYIRYAKAKIESKGIAAIAASHPPYSCIAPALLLLALAAPRCFIAPCMLHSLCYSAA